MIFSVVKSSTDASIHINVMPYSNDPVSAYLYHILLRMGGLQWVIKVSFEIRRRFGKTETEAA
jgi:hypothetical protein